jgi:hypothetical protein
MVKTQQLMRFEMYTILALDDTIRGFFAMFCRLGSRVNLILLTLVADYRNFTTNGAPGPATRPGRRGVDRKWSVETTRKPGARRP